LKTKSHIIEKVVVEINTTQVKTANFIKNNIDMFLKKELFPKLEELFQKYDRPDAVVRFHELNIDLNTKNWENPNQIKFEILFEIEENLRKELKKEETIKNISDYIVSPEGQKHLQNLTINENEEEIFVFFLKNGFLPWYGNEHQIQAFQKKDNWQNSFENAEFIERLSYLFKKDYPTFFRFIYQFPVEMVVKFIQKLNPRLAKADKQLNKIFQKLQPDLGMELLHTIFSISVEEKSEKIVLIFRHWLNLLELNEKLLIRDGILSKLGQFSLHAVPEALIGDEKFQEILNQTLYLISENKFSEEIQSDLSKVANKKKVEIYQFKRDRVEKDAEHRFFSRDIQEIAVRNAGLIILHPFLKHFFTVVKITNKLGNIIPDKKALAVQTLHFLATGSEEFFEGNLVFEKFLCGMPLNMPVPQKSRLTPGIVRETETLLTEVIKNWPVLKNTSPAGLQQMFLQRDGKLIQNDKNFKLIIERKAQDILLERLEWNISVIKLKWLSEMLFVDW
jgi:hypothetical protein